MRVIFLIKYYDGFINTLENKLKQYPEFDYQQSLNYVTRESANIFAPFIRVFKNLGIDSELIIPNFKILQEKWANENGATIKSDWQFSIPQLQIKQLKPDILFLNSNFEYYTSFHQSVRPYVKKTCAWISCPFEKKLDLSNIDHVFTLFGPHYEFFTKKGIHCTLTHGGFDQFVLNEINTEPKYDFSFVGGIGGYHHEREVYLRKLVKSTPIKLWGYGFKSPNSIKNIVKQLKSGWVFNNAYMGHAWGKDMIEVLAQSKITFNIHGDIAKGHAVNMRMFEATGAGTLLLTEASEKLHEFFEIDHEVVTYSTVEEAIKKVNYYMSHEDERIKIAKAGQKRTLQNYTYEHLSEVYVNIFNKLLNKK